MREVTYQVAHDDLAVTRALRGLGGIRLVGGGAARRSRCLLNTADRGSGRRATTSGSTLRATAGSAGRAALGRENLIERLVKLSRHDDCGGVGFV